MDKLVIVESPNKISSIKKYLGKDYEILSSVGHIVYLPPTGPHRFGINMDDWTPLYKIDPKKRKTINELKKAIKKKKEIYIATDPDREGEAIGDNLVTFLKLEDNYKRIRFNEITESAVKEAIKNPSKINAKLVNSQVARRILDRIIGFKLSKLMNTKIYNSPITPSAGRVQSIALKLVVEREAEIEKFVPVKYAKIEAKLAKGLLAILTSANFQNKKEWIDPAKLYEILESLNDELIVASKKVTEKTDRKHEPLKQSSLYKRGNSVLGLTAKSIRNAAQRLYEGYGDGGLISYPRTDSTRLSKTFLEHAKKFIENQYGARYVSNQIKGRAGSQDAHEAIRPTNCELTPNQAKEKFNLSSSEEKVYTLIYNHTLTTLMKPAVRKITSYNFTNNQHKFRLSSSNIIFDGYLIVNGIEKTQAPPVFEIGQKVPVEEFVPNIFETNPPPRYNDGSLIETLDKIKVGRPSTFESIVTTLKKRMYVSLEGKAFKATKFGKIVYEKLSGAFPKIIDEKYTAKMEEKLDSVANGKTTHQEILGGFWDFFEKDLEYATQSISLTKLSSIPAGKECEKCGAELVVRFNKKSQERFFACSKFPECKHTESDPTQKKRSFYKKNNFPKK